MVDLASEMAQLWTSLGPPIPGYGRVISFVSATSGEGVSTIAREFAAFAAERVKRNVWLVELGVPTTSQARAFVGDRMRYGPLGREAAGSPDGSAFFVVQPAMRGPDGRPWPNGRYLAAHRVGERRLWLTRFRRELMRPGQTARVVPSGEYWSALHLDGMAADVRINGVQLEHLQKAALNLRRGGVGLYPKSGFVHIDVGPVRRWQGT